MQSSSQLIDAAIKYGQGIILLKEDNTEVRFYALNDKQFLEVDTLTKRESIIGRKELNARIKHCDLAQGGYDFLLI